MFVGHYAAAYAAKAVQPALPLWLLFVAVQLVDFGWAILVLLGIEKVRVVPGFTEASPLDLYYMPFTHGLISAVIWAVAFGALYVLVRRGSGLFGQGVVLALAVFSHWLADLIVHVPDLPLLLDEPKVGFGLWNNFWASQGLEVGLLLGAVIWYVSASTPANRIGKVAPWILIAVLLAMQAFSHFPSETVPTSDMFAAQALVVFSLLAGLAFWTERHRSA
jgi:membrane-bound metal-dependent hydrolase YbcI (DUF457 family)